LFFHHSEDLPSDDKLLAGAVFVIRVAAAELAHAMG
jgi:hypothetical protein